MAVMGSTKAPVRPAAGTWRIDGAHTTVAFIARHLMVTKVRGRFNAFDGVVTVGERVEDSRADVTIDAASIDTGVDFRDNHLRSADFLDVEQYPHLRFVSTAVRQTGEETLEIDGELTIRDVTRPVTLDATFDGVSTNYDGSERAGFTATTDIDREDWGITWNQALESGGVLVSKKVKIELDVQLIRDTA